LVQTSTIYKKHRKCPRKKEGKGKAIPPADGTKTLKKRSELRRWLVLALVGMLLMFSCALLLVPKEALAKGGGNVGGDGDQAPTRGGGSSDGGGPVGAAKSAGDALGGALGGAANGAPNGATRDAGGKTVGDATKNGITGDKGTVGHAVSDPVGAANQAIKEATGPTGPASPIATEADRALNEAMGAGDSVTKEAGPTLGEAAGKVAGPAIEETANSPLIGTAKETVEPVVAPVLNVTKPVTDSVLDTTSPIVSPLDGAIGPVVNPILDTTSPVTGALLDEGMPSSAQPAFQPAIEPAAPIYGAIEPSAGTALVPRAPPEGVVSPAVEPVFSGERIAPLLLGNVEPSDFASLPTPTAASGTPASLPVSLPATSGVPVLSPIASNTAMDPSAGALASSAKYPGLSGALLRSLNSSLERSLLGGVLGAVANAVANGAQEPDRAPMHPFGFPDGAPVGGSAFSSSGFGIGLDLLAALALLSLLSRVGGSSRPPRDFVKLVSSFRLVTELPG
jgi:hypothetical protein